MTLAFKVIFISYPDDDPRPLVSRGDFDYYDFKLTFERVFKNKKKNREKELGSDLSPVRRMNRGTQREIFSIFSEIPEIFIFSFLRLFQSFLRAYW